MFHDLAQILSVAGVGAWVSPVALPVPASRPRLRFWSNSKQEKVPPGAHRYSRLGMGCLPLKKRDAKLTD